MRILGGGEIYSEKTWQNSLSRLTAKRSHHQWCPVDSTCPEMTWRGCCCTSTVLLSKAHNSSVTTRETSDTKIEAHSATYKDSGTFSSKLSRSSKQGASGSSLWCSWLRIWRRLSHSAGHSWSSRLTPDPGTSTDCRCGQKQNKANKQTKPNKGHRRNLSQWSLRRNPLWQVKDMALPQLGHRLHLRFGFDPWPRTFTCPRHSQKNPKQTNNKHQTNHRGV